MHYSCCLFFIKAVNAKPVFIRRWLLKRETLWSSFHCLFVFQHLDVRSDRRPAILDEAKPFVLESFDLYKVTATPCRTFTKCENIL